MRRIVILLMFFSGAAPVAWAGSPSTKKAAETKNESGQILKQDDLPKGAKPPSAHTNEQPPKPKLESPKQ